MVGAIGSIPPAHYTRRVYGCTCALPGAGEHREPESFHFGSASRASAPTGAMSGAPSIISTPPMSPPSSPNSSNFSVRFPTRQPRRPSGLRDPQPDRHTRPFGGALAHHVVCRRTPAGAVCGGPGSGRDGGADFALARHTAGGRRFPQVRLFQLREKYRRRIEDAVLSLDGDDAARVQARVLGACIPTEHIVSRRARHLQAELVPPQAIGHNHPLSSLPQAAAPLGRRLASRPPGAVRNTR